MSEETFAVSRSVSCMGFPPLLHTVENLLGHQPEDGPQHGHNGREINPGHGRRVGIVQLAGLAENILHQPVGIAGEAVDDGEDDVDQDNGADHGHRDFPEGFPRRGPLHAGRLIQAARDGLKPRQEQENLHLRESKAG